jgi:hypothetical protein
VKPASFKRGQPNHWRSKKWTYLGIMGLLGQSDPFLLCEHIKKYRNAGKGIPSYLSVKICKEFIELMGSKVLAAIVNEIQKAKNFSISVDSTPHVTHIDQLTFIHLKICKECCSKRAMFAVYSHSWT